MSLFILMSTNDFDDCLGVLKVSTWNGYGWFKGLFASEKIQICSQKTHISNEKNKESKMLWMKNKFRKLWKENKTKNSNIPRNTHAHCGTVNNCSHSFTVMYHLLLISSSVPLLIRMLNRSTWLHNEFRFF